MDPQKVPKTCITQFSVHRKPFGYRQADFYTTAVDQARIELFRSPPFAALSALQGPWMPTIGFVKPAFKLPNTKDTCVYIKSYPSQRELMLLSHSHDFGNEKTAPHQKLYIIFDLVLKSKFQLEKIKTETPEATPNTVATDCEYNLASRTLLENAEKVVPMLDENVTQAETEWYNALLTYKEQRQISPDNLVQIQPRPYQPALTVQDHAPALIHVTEVQHLVNNRGQVKPNLQIQIKTAGGREVFHTPDTTGTPLATPTEAPTETPQPVVVALQPESITQGQPHAMQPQIIGLTPEMLRTLMQQAQPAPAQVPMHLRLGPPTPPVKTEKPPLPPKKRRHQSGQRAERRQQRMQKVQNHNWRMDKRPRWNHNDEPDRHNREEDDNHRPSRPRSREAPHNYYNRDPRHPSYNRGRPSSYNNERPQPYYDRQPDRNYRPRSRSPSYERHHPDQKYHSRPDSPPAKRTQDADPEKLDDLAKILNVPPEKMNEAYQILGALSRIKNSTEKHT